MPAKKTPARRRESNLFMRASSRAGRINARGGDSDTYIVYPKQCVRDSHWLIVATMARGTIVPALSKPERVPVDANHENVDPEEISERSAAPGRTWHAADVRRPGRGGEWWCRFPAGHHRHQRPLV